MPNIKKFIMNYKYLLPIVLVGFLLRIIYVSNLDFYYDEASHAMGQKALIEKGTSPWDTVNWQPPLYSYTASILTRILGLSEFSFRLTSVIFGTLTIVLVYYLGNLLYNKKIGLLAAILLAVSPLHVVYSRTAFSDVFHTFFIVLTILTMEFLILKNPNGRYTMVLVLLSGMLSAVAFLIKYNTLIPLGIYWIFILGRAMLKHKKNIFKKYFVYMILINIMALITSIFIILLTGGISRLVLLIHNVLLSALLQFEQFANPSYYTFLVLFEGLSPLIALLVPLGIIYILLHKERNRNDYLVVFFVLAYIILFLLQTRRLARHLVMIFPFLMIMLSRFFTLFVSRVAYAKKHLNFVLLFLLLILSSLGWSIYEINKTSGFHVWTELADYIKKNYPEEITVHGSLHKNRFIGYYIRNADNHELVTSLKKGDLVIFTWLYNNTTIMENSPFEDNVMTYRKKRSEFSSEFISYVTKHGELIKTFEYKQGTAAWLYEIKSTDRNVKDAVKEDPFAKTSLFGVWNIVCKVWNKENIRVYIEKITSRDYALAIQIKCKSLT